MQECYPYLARRLFTDRSPRAKTALRAMLGLSPLDVDGVVVPTALGKAPQPQSAFGALMGDIGGGGGGAAGGKSGMLSPAKLIEMSDQFAEATAVQASVDRDGAGAAAAARELTNLVLAPEGSTLQVTCPLPLSLAALAPSWASCPTHPALPPSICPSRWYPPPPPSRGGGLKKI